MKINTILGASLLSLSLFSCSGDDSSSDSSSDKDSGEKGSKTETVSCDESNTASFSSEKIDGSGFEVISIHATRHNMSAGDQTYPAVNILMMDYDTEGSAYKSPAGDDRKIILMISGKAGEEMAAGEYPVFGTEGFGADRASSFTLVTESENVGMYGAGGSGTASGTCTITHASENHICGTIDATDSKGTKLTASFSTEVKKPLGGL